MVDSQGAYIRIGSTVSINAGVTGENKTHDMLITGYGWCANDADFRDLQKLGGKVRFFYANETTKVAVASKGAPEAAEPVSFGAGVSRGDGDAIVWGT